jgi:hypothetical protein
VSVAVPIVEGGEVVGVVCVAGPMRELSRKPHGETRWCFRCRARRDFELVISAEVEPSYYGPSADVRCATCGGADADLFPGRYREWVEPEWEDGPA